MSREDFKEQAKKSIDDIFVKMDELEAKKNTIEGHAKAKHKEKINDMKTKKKELQAKYDDLSDASDEKWEEVKSAFSSASDSFKEGFSKITDLV